MQKFFFKLLFTAGGWLGVQLASAQPIPLTDLNAFRQPVSPNWKLASEVSADLAKPNVLLVKSGTGVLVCQPTSKAGAQPNLITQADYGDADIELDFMMAKGSNSGVYLQGRYELQLTDSWGVMNPKASDIGAIYERWDDSKPEGQKGYEGHPARQNAGKAPGLWQHLKIAFQAPRFDASGKKTENARFLRVELNGILIHENVEVSGPTRGPLTSNEAARGPLLFQGDHGAVAFRNITVNRYDNAQPRLSNLSYSVYKGSFRNETSFGGAAPEARGTSPILSAAVNRIPNNFAIQYTGTLHVDQAGEYTFNTTAGGGLSRLTINNQPVGNPRSQRGGGKVTLPQGDLPFELVYSKFEEWNGPNLELAVEGPGVRRYLLTPNVATPNEADPILVTAETNTLLRSFMDLPKAKNAQGRTYRVTHAISVGSPQQVHYTYDADNGSIVQVWRGMFLDATPMWESRGDGSSRPMGAVNYLGTVPQLMMARLSSAQAPWPADTASSGFRPKGYALDANDQPTFKYLVGATSVDDQIRVLPEGYGLRRDLTVSQPGTGLYARLADAESIEAMPNNLYAVNGKSYYIQLNDSSVKPVVRTSNGRQELLVPVSGKVSYSILF